MVCCVILGFILATLRAVWRLLTFQRPTPRVLFAPPAQRAAPGSLAPQTPLAAQTVAEMAGRDFWLIRFIAVAPAVLACMGVYWACVLLAEDHGLLLPLGSETQWQWRAIVYAICAGALLLLYLHHRRTSRLILSARRYASNALAACGATWLMMGVADLHLFEVMQWGGVALVACREADSLAQWLWAMREHLQFHGVGLVAIVLGGVLAARQERPTVPPPLVSASHV